MKLRIISDIHADINQERNYQFDFGEDFVIACGDISGDRITTEMWIRSNIKRGVFVEGNHLGYEKVTRDEKDTKQGSIEYLNAAFSSETVKFLENNIYIVDDI